MTDDQQTEDARSPDSSSKKSHTVSDLLLSGLSIKAGDLTLLESCDAKIPGGKITVIVGGSGAGKSILLRVISGLIDRHHESIRFDGKIHLQDSADGEAIKAGVVFQQFALFDELSPTANVQFAIDHRTDKSKKPEQTSAQWLSELGVPAKTGIAKLSGGQKQRLAIARTLAADPEIILYDEPTSGLDAASGKKVANLIQQTQQAHRRTSVVVTHDYETLLPIADEVLLLDSQSKQLVSIPKEDWRLVPTRMQPVQLDDPPETSKPDSAGQRAMTLADRFVQATGAAALSALKLPIDLNPIVPRPKWGFRFVWHYVKLIGGFSAWIYLLLAGLIAGFTTTYFTFRFLPFRMYTQPLLIDELLSSIGFALYRILVPVLATVLIAARCGAAVAADVGVKQYGGQVDAMKTLGVRPQQYLLLPIVIAFVVATPLLEWLAFTSAKYISLLTFSASYAEIGPYFWQQHFFRNLRQTPETALWGLSGMHWGWHWVLMKNVLCGVGTAAIGYHRGMSPKHSASDVSNAITSTVLWATLYVLVVHFAIAFYEFSDAVLR